MSEFQIFLADEEATIEFGKKLANATFANPDQESEPAQLEGAESIGGTFYLQGDLGAGKTTLTRGFMRGYGYHGAVKSPTYTLVEPYEFKRCHIYHFDLYRLADPEEVNYMGTEDYFAGNNVCLIEWAEKGANAISPPDLIIELSGEGTGRQLNCQSCSDKGQLITQRLWPTGRKI